MKHLFKSLKPPSVESASPTFLKSLRNTLQKYQTVIFFSLLVISLIIFLMLWQNYRLKQLTEKGRLEVEHASRIEKLQSLLQTYNSTELNPLIHYKLANAYFEAERYPEARQEYELILNEYSEHWVNPLVSNRLKELKVNEVWSKDELSERLNELKAQRNLPVVLIQTKKGEFKVILYEDDAPNTVANFINLVEKQFYNGVRFGSRDEKIGLCLNEQSITPTITTTLHYTIPFEVNNLENKEGSLGMLREIDPDTETGRPEREQFLNSANWKFYIALETKPELDEKYTVFGRVTQGMDIVKKLQPGDIIETIVIKNKRTHEYQPSILGFSH